MRFLDDGKPIVRRCVCVESESNCESWLGAVDPWAVAFGKTATQCIAFAGRTETALLRNAWAYDKSAICQHLGLWEAMLAVSFFTVATCWERLACASCVLLVAVVLCSRLVVLQHAVKFLCIFTPICLQLLFGYPSCIDVRTLVFPCESWDAAELRVVLAPSLCPYPPAHASECPGMSGKKPNKCILSAHQKKAEPFGSCLRSP